MGVKKNMKETEKEVEVEKSVKSWQKRATAKIDATKHILHFGFMDLSDDNRGR